MAGKKVTRPLRIPNMRLFSRFVATCAVAAAACNPAFAQSLLIPANKIYTSPDAEPLLNGTVLLRDGRIASVADERSRIAIPEGTQTSECRGVVVAGFQNSHVHLMGPSFDNAARKPAAEIEQAVESMLTRYGVTTAFDTGSDQANTIALRSRIEKKELRGPRILTAGWPLYPRNGIPFYLRDLPPHILNGLHQPKDAAEARTDVRANLDAGADGTKLFMVTSPRMGESLPLPADIARAAVVETHARGKLVLAHPTSLAGVRAALDAGVDVIVHTTLGEKDPWDAALTREMVARKMSVIPTIKLWPYELAKQQVPKEITDKLVAATLAELRAFKEAGGQILFGTDVGYMQEFDPTDEYRLMSQAGLSPMDILASLTTAPADRWKETARRGRVAAGLDADLVVLKGDPAEDVANFAQVRCVFRGGQLIYSAP
jgi:imidazolonepropionase-like amidohydrolase